ncbi:MAG: hypothetical protein QM610_06150 [Chitinophagaceae bacterium]
MEKKLGYAFDDEYVTKFCYDIENKKLEINFTGYYDLINNAYVDAPCVWTLENWEYAESILGNEQKRYDLNKHIGVFSIILYMKYNDNDELEMLVNTLDNRYITLFFKAPKLSLK